MSGNIKLNTPSSGSVTLSAADTASNLTATVPAATDTLVNLTSTQTLTNKTIASLVTTGTATFGGLINTGSTGQIQFPATQNPSSDANTLDDYEEGTWTPYVNGTVALQTSRYVKIGQMVFCEVVSYNVNISSIGTTTSLSITGLPFAMNTYQYCMPCGYQGGQIFGIFDGNGTTAPLGQGGTAADYQSITRNTFGGTGSLSFRFSFTYRTTN